MYKKIKNGSFMNLIWFIICILPLLFITCDYFNNSSKYVEGERVDNKIIYRDATKHTSSEHFYQWQTDDLVISNDEVACVSAGNNNILNYITLDIQNYGEDNMLCGVVVNATTEEWAYISNYIYVYYRIRDIRSDYSCQYYGCVENYDNEVVVQNETSSNNEWAYIKMSYREFVDADIHFMIYVWLDMVGQTEVWNPCEVDLFICQTEVNLESTDNLFYKYTNGYYDLLQTIQTNGFISSAFLNLATLFGVNNVYYSIACYYIEYLLVIALLHLAFDVLYMLPNICHKFMEKLGGERD